MLLRVSVLISNNFSCNTCWNECMCYCCVLHACLKHCCCFRFSCCVILLHLLLMNTMLYVTHTLLNMYLILFRFIANTNNWLEKFAYSTRHILSKHSAALCLIPLVADRQPQRLGLELGPPFDIRYRKVAHLQVFIQVLPFSPVITFHQRSVLMLHCAIV